MSSQSSSSLDISIRTAQPSDWSAIWQIAQPVFQAEETYPYAPDISAADAYKKWMSKPTATYVATDPADQVLGTYYIVPNQPALGAHVCNCGYIVSDRARNKGIASLMCHHSQQEARRLGFRAMQFNLVVATNQVSVYLWQKLGFEKVGALPGAFKHPKYGFVDAFVMYKSLGATERV